MDTDWWLSAGLKALELIGSALDSNFAIALISAFAGAFAGALGAQRISERARKRDELVKELRNTNVAIMVAFSTCNAALALKKQHVAPLHENFAKQKAAALAAIAQSSRGEGPTYHHIEADLKIFPPPESPIETLKDITFHGLSAYGRLLALVSALEQTAVGLRSAIQMREELVRHFASGAVPEQIFYMHYLGLKTPDGNTHQEYADTVEAIKSYTDDMAFFSALLTDDLVAHGHKVAENYRKRFGKGGPSVSTVDFSRPREIGLIPSESEYKQWLDGFSEKNALVEKQSITGSGSLSP